MVGRTEKRKKKAEEKRKREEIAAAEAAKWERSTTELVEATATTEAEATATTEAERRKKAEYVRKGKGKVGEGSGFRLGAGTRGLCFSEAELVATAELTASAHVSGTAVTAARESGAEKKKKKRKRGEKVVVGHEEDEPSEKKGKRTHSRVEAVKKKKRGREEKASSSQKKKQKRVKVEEAETGAEAARAACEYKRKGKAKVEEPREPWVEPDNRIWFIRTHSVSVKPEVFKEGGGICVSPDGLVVTSADLFNTLKRKTWLGNVAIKKQITEGRFHSECGFRELQHIRRYRSHGIALYRAVPKFQGEVFDCFTLPDAVNLDRMDDLAALVHGASPFLLRSGIVSSPHSFPNPSFIPYLSDPSLVRKLLRDLRLIELQGIGGPPGFEGCPLFTVSGVLVGLLLFSFHGSSYAVSIDRIRQVLEAHL